MWLRLKYNWEIANCIKLKLKVLNFFCIFFYIKYMLRNKFQTIQEKKVEIEAKEKVCKKITIAAEEDLNAAMPALEEAKKVKDYLLNQKKMCL